MRFFKYYSILLICLFTSQFHAEIPFIFDLMWQVAHCKKIVRAKYLYHDQYQHYFLSKRLSSSQEYTDTIKLYINSEPFQIKDNRGTTSQFFSIEQIDEILIFVSESDRKDSTQVSGPIFIKFNDKVYIPWSFSIMDKMNWSEFLDRIDSIERRMNPILNLKDKPKLPDRNKVLLAWLQDFIQNDYDTCRQYEDCGWGRLEYDVIDWIVTSGDMEDAWTASQYHRQIEIRKRPRLTNNPIFGLYEGYCYTYNSESGIDFLLQKALDEHAPLSQRNQALSFMTNAVMDIYNCSKKYPHDCTVSKPELQKSTLKKIMPVLHKPELNYYAFLVYQHLCYGTPEYANYPLTQFRFKEIIQLFEENRYNDTDFRYVLADFLAEICTSKQWDSISGNQNNLLIHLAGSEYDSTYQRLNFFINTNKRDPSITEIPKIKFERINNGQIDTSLIKESIQYYKPPLESTSAKEMEADVSDLPPGTWHFTVFGVAGKNEKVPWTSLGGTFVQKEKMR
jgi:hypothetical protein